MGQFMIFPNEQFAHNSGVASGAASILSFNNLQGFLDIIDGLSNGTTNLNFTTGFVDGFCVTQREWVNNQFLNCNSLPNGWTYGTLWCLVISGLTAEIIAEWNNRFAGGSLNFIINEIRTVEGVSNTVSFHINKAVLPQFPSNASEVVITSDVCDYIRYKDDTAWQRSQFFVGSNSGLYQFSISSGVNCDDLRTSDSTQECLITLNIVADTGESVSDSYNLLFQPDSNHTSGSVSNINLYNFSSISGVTCRFIRGVVRDSGIITIRGRIHGTLTKTPEQVSTGLVPVVEFFDENVILFQGSFEPCCDTPVSWGETYTDVLGDLKTSDVMAIIGICEVTSIEWSGFGLLTDYCCDDSDCPDIDTTFPPNSLIVDGGDSGGGDSGGGGFDECVCDWLESIDGKLGLINTSIGGLNCICTKLDSLISAINGLDLSVNNQITVTPSTAQITTPVNAPVTVNPPVNQITVNPTPITNTVTPCSPTVTVNPTDLTGLISAINGLELSASVTNNIDGLTCENSLGEQESLACIIKEAFNYGGESISEIHKKAFSTVDDCCNEEINLIDTLNTSNDEGCKVTFADLVKNKEFGSFLDVTIENDEIMQYRKSFKDPLNNG